MIVAWKIYYQRLILCLFHLWYCNTLVRETFNYKLVIHWIIWGEHHAMPYSKLKIVIERIILNTYKEMVCRCPFQSWKLYLKGSPLTLVQKLWKICSPINHANCQIYSNVDMFVTKTSQEGLEVAIADQIPEAWWLISMIAKRHSSWLALIHYCRAPRPYPPK